MTTRPTDRPSLTAIAGTHPPAGDPGCQCLPATPTVDAAQCDDCRTTEGVGA